MFNALKYTQELEKAGFTREQAETSVRFVIEVMNETFATKSDLKELELKMESRFDVLESHFNAKLQELEFRLTTRMGGLMTALIGIAVALIKIH